MHFKVAVGEYLPFLKVTPVLGSVYMSGPLAEAFHALSLRLNFTYTLYKVKGNSWGKYDENGWTGMLGMVEKGEVDMAVGPFTLTYDRWESFKLSTPVYVDNIEILAPVSEWKMTLFSVLTVFSHTVWLVLFMCVILLSLVITVIDKYKQNDVTFFLRFFRNCWDVLLTLLQKGRREKPDFYIQAFLSATWMFLALVVSSTFGGVLLTRLFVRKVQRIDSIDDLIASPKVQPILEDHSSIYGMFKTSQSVGFQSIFQRAISKPDTGIMNYDDMRTIGMNHVQRGISAILSDGMGLKGFMAGRQKEGLPCRYWLAKETVRAMWKVLAFGTQFPDEWIVKFNRQLRVILESGWLHARMQREFVKYEECVSPGGNKLTPLGIEHTQGIFIIWLTGILTSTLALLVEYNIKRWGKNSLEKKRKTRKHRVIPRNNRDRR